ncbi:MAG TPA: (d)CMP kinase [Marmoricola sp.]|nr:(d)CMP kinase [Marmoricola sp.]
MSCNVVVAMDGTSGSGKSSTARGVAARLGMRYLDTGAQFRALTVWLLDRGVDVHDRADVAARIAEPRLESGTDPTHATIVLDGVDVSVRIRQQDVTDAVSPVATVPEVRARLLEAQRALISAALAAGTGIVVEGRDIGSVVWPDAELKLHLTADPSARAARRTAENGSGDSASTEESLRRRDRIDSTRAAAPLTVADGAVHLDTTHHTLEEVIGLVAARVVAAANEASGARGGTPPGPDGP